MHYLRYPVNPVSVYKNACIRHPARHHQRLITYSVDTVICPDGSETPALPEVPETEYCYLHHVRQQLCNVYHMRCLAGTADCNITDTYHRQGECPALQYAKVIQPVSQSCDRPVNNRGEPQADFPWQDHLNRCLCTRALQPVHLLTR